MSFEDYSEKKKVIISFKEGFTLFTNLWLGLHRLAVLFPAGSLRRKHDQLGDLDIVVVLEPNVKDTDFFEAARKVIGSSPSLGGKPGAKKAQFYTEENQLVDFYLCDPDKLGPMMLFLTGSGDFNKRTRSLAKRRRLGLNQYGLFKRDEEGELTTETFGEQTEKGIMESLGLTYLEPWDREK